MGGLPAFCRCVTIFLFSVGFRPAIEIKSGSPRLMSRQDANAAFAVGSFLYGGNASYIEDLYARYEADPKAVDAQWRAFFQSLKDEKSDVVRGARGASWKAPNWPVRPDGDLVAA